MQQLTGVDQMFLGLETATTNCLVGALTVFEAPAEGQPVPDEAFMVQRLRDRLEYAPPFHMVLVTTPLGLDHNYLAEAKDVDVPAHVRTVRLPAPGNHEQFCQEISRLMEEPMLGGRPLWDMTIIEGMAGGGLAHLLRFSHGVIDGSLMTRVYNILSDDPGPLEHPDTQKPHREPRFGKPEMLARGLLGVARQPARMVGLQVAGTKWMIERFPQDGPWAFPAFLARMVPGELGKPLTSLINIRQRAAGQPEITPYYPTMVVPRTPITGHISAERQFVLVDLELSDFKTVTHGFSTTLNNAVVTVAAGAVRRYMQARGILPKRPLIVCCPVSMRRGDEKEPWANYVNMIQAPLPTHLADPVDRLEWVVKELKRAKGSFDGMPMHLMRESSRMNPRFMYGLMSGMMAKAPTALTFPMYNVTVSNVRGPDKINTLNGLRVAAYYPCSFLTPGGGINISLWSYRDHLFFGIVGEPKQVEDLWPLARYMKESLAELVHVAQGNVAREPSAALTLSPS